MQVQIRKTNPQAGEPGGEWHITGLSGILEGKLLGTCEGVSLNHVSFHEGFMIGRPTAVWGATLTEEAYGTSARDLGVGRPFSPLRGSVRVFPHMGQFISPDQRPLKDADRVFLFHSSIFVQKERYSHAA